MENARAIYEVVAGIVPGQPDAKHTRRFGVTSKEFEEKGVEVLLERWNQAVAWATFLQLLCANGMEINWVRIDFVWP